MENLTRTMIISQINQIIEKLEMKDKNKIPINVRKFFQTNAIKDKYVINFDKPLKEQLSEEAVKVLVYIYSYLK